MLTSTYFNFFKKRPGLNELPPPNKRSFWKVENYMSAPALTQVIAVNKLINLIDRRKKKMKITYKASFMGNFVRHFVQLLVTLMWALK